MLGLVVVATAVTALVARNLYHQQAAAPPAHTSTTQSSSVAGTTPQDTGSTAVLMSPDVAGSPQGQQVQKVLQTYFDAINQRNYAQLLTAVSQARAAQQSEADFVKDYKSTKDSDIHVLRIDTNPTGLSVLTSFRSEQDLAHAPVYARFTCIQWMMVLPIVQEGGLKVDSSITLTSPQTQQCS